MANMIYTNIAGVPSPAGSGLASRAASILAGVLKSGFEHLAQFRALEEWRLWRFKSLLAVSRLSIGNLQRQLGEKTIPEAGLIQLWEVGPVYFVLNHHRISKEPRQAVKRD
jgi:hypothetical protein